MRWILLILLLLNAYAYALMWLDKQAAIAQRRRTPERQLFRIAACGGSLGIWLGTRAPLYHKRAKAPFKRRLTMITALQAIALLILAYFYVGR